MTQTSVSQASEIRPSLSKENNVKPAERPASIGGASVLLMVLLNGMILQNALVSNGSYKYMVVTIPLLLFAIIDHYRHMGKHH